MSLSLPRLSSVSSSFSLPFAPAVAMNPFCIPWISNIFKFSWVFFPAFTCRIAYWSTRSQSIRCGQDTSIKSKTSFLMAESSRAGECVPFQHSENMWYFIVHTVVILHSAYTMNTWDDTLIVLSPQHDVERGMTLRVQPWTRWKTTISVYRPGDSMSSSRS